MPHRLRLPLAAFAVAALLSTALVGSAAASRALRIEPAGAIEATMERFLIRQPAGIEIWCNVTLRGNLAASVNKTVGAGFGGITEARTRECRGNEFVVGPPSLIFLTPIPMTYNSFLGTLPNITGILVNFNPMKLRIDEERRPVEVRCLYEGVVGILLPLLRSEFESFGFLREEIRLKEGIPIEECEARSRLTGAFTVRPTQRVTLV